MSAGKTVRYNLWAIDMVNPAQGLGHATGGFVWYIVMRGTANHARRIMEQPTCQIWMVVRQDMHSAIMSRM